MLRQVWHACHMIGSTISELPRREREIFEILCSGEEFTAAAVRARMNDAPSYSAVRTLLRRLEERGLVTHRSEDQTYLYKSLPQPSVVRNSALRQLVKTFFGGSSASAATALLGLSKDMSAEELDALERAIEKARKQAQ